MAYAITGDFILSVLASVLFLSIGPATVRLLHSTGLTAIHLYSQFHSISYLPKMDSWIWSVCVEQVLVLVWWFVHMSFFLQCLWCCCYCLPPQSLNKLKFNQSSWFSHFVRVPCSTTYLDISFCAHAQNYFELVVLLRIVWMWVLLNFFCLSLWNDFSLSLSSSSLLQSVYSKLCLNNAVVL